MRQTAILFLKGPNTRKLIRKRADLYDAPLKREDLLEFQTRRFNDVWGRALLDSPFYRRWAEVHSLPPRVKDIRDVSSFPVLTKKEFTEYSKCLTSSPGENFYISGGSTGEPTKVPRGDHESGHRYANAVVARSWLGLSPGDRYVHLWGHAHLFGTGRAAAIRKQARKAKDWLVGGYRLNAYVQSKDELQNWIKTIETRRPKYLIGYTSALLNLAQFIRETRGKLNAPSLKWIIPTSETITSRESSLLVEVFGASVAIEYGAVESGIIAQSRPYVGDKLHVLWGSIAANVDEAGALRLSTLDPRKFPLINYEIGDRVEDADNMDLTLAFSSVSGRIGEELSLRMSDGTVARIRVNSIVNALWRVDGVRTVQAAQTADESAEVYVTGPVHGDEKAMKATLLAELRNVGVFLRADSLTLMRLDNPIRSIAGKVNRLVPRIAARSPEV